MASQDNDYLTPTEVASLLLVSPITVRQWAQKGLILAHTTAGGHRRFERAEVARFARERGIEIAGLKTTVLVVDDDRQLNNFLVAMFTAHEAELEIHSAYDGFEAGRLVQQHQPDIVLLDIMMPGMDGVEVCRSIKGEPSTAGANVVAMTGHHSEQLERRVLEAGASVLLKKPFDTDEMLAYCGLGPL